MKVSVDHDILLNHQLWACPNPCVPKMPIFSSVPLHQCLGLGMVMQHTVISLAGYLWLYIQAWC